MRSNHRGVSWRFAAIAPVSAVGIALSTGAIAQDASGTPESSGDSAEILVTGSRASRQAAIERKREAPTIRDVIASDGIGKLPDYNTAEALQRLPGVSVEIDQGEPRYVVIRGVDPNLNQVTIDGNLVGVPEAEGRRVSLDTIPSDLVAAIEIVKAVTPDYDANAVGGSINIITRSAFDQPEDLGQISARGSYNDRADKLGFGVSGVFTKRFGADDTFGVAVGASYFKRFLDTQLAEFDWQEQGGALIPEAYRFYDYRIMRKRIGGILNLEWRPDNETRVYVRNIYNEFTDHEERDQIEQTILGAATVVSPAEVRYARGRAGREYRQNNQTQKLFNISPGADFRLGTIEVGLNYTYAHAEEHTPVRDDIEFRSASIIDTTLDLSERLPKVAGLDPRLLDQATFPLRNMRLRTEKIDEDLHAARADLTYRFEGSAEGFIKVGGKYTDRKKTRDSQRFQFEPVGTALTLASMGAELAGPKNFFGGRYTFGPAMDYRALLDYLGGNPARFKSNLTADVTNAYNLDYDISERIYAAYAMGQVEMGQLTVAGGVRMEKTDGRYGAFAVRDADGDGTLTASDVRPLSFDNDYTDVLPSLHVTYRPADKVMVRAAWTNTLGRPNYDAVVPTFSEDGGEGSAGNPDLKPYKAMGLDLSVEYYPDRDSLFSAGIFYRDIKNPIFTRTLLNTEFAGIPLTELSQPFNATSAHILGIEANAQYRFSFLPAPLDGFGFSANLTYTTSKMKVPGREGEKIGFFRQPDWIANAALFYEKGPFEARVALNFQDDFLTGVGADAVGDTFTRGRTVIDARAGYRISEGIEIFGSIANINDAALIDLQTADRRFAGKEIYSFTADFGVNVRF
ncbi:MAG: TonB-dependent receptor [Thiohalobacteraceae bacterium]